jgi:acetylornithine deacetylase/succinyl-diaminopimelate desuccinylase-like protein
VRGGGQSALLGYSIAEVFKSVLIEVYGHKELSHEKRVIAMDIISLLYDLKDLVGIFRKLKTQLEFIDDVILYEYKKLTMTPLSSDLCIGISRSAWKSLGLWIKPLISPSADPEPIFRTMGIPTILYGPGFTVNLHSDFEIVSLRNIRLIARIVEDLIVNWDLGHG